MIVFSMLLFLILALINVYRYIVVLRFLLVVYNISPFNQIHQFSQVLTNPLVKLFWFLPLRYKKLEIIIFIICVALGIITEYCKWLLLGGSNTFSGAFMLSIVSFFQLLLTIYTVAIVFSVLQSFLPIIDHPFLYITHSLSNSILSRIKVPSIANIDISPMIALLLLSTLQFFLNNVLSI